MTVHKTGLLALAAHGIAARLGSALRPPVWVLYSQSKQPLAEALMTRLNTQGIHASATNLAKALPASRALKQAAARGSVIILADPSHAGWLFEAVGRPDRRLLIPMEHIYCDWLMPYDGLLRTLAADYGRLRTWRSQLLHALHAARSLQITTAAGTDLWLELRHWVSLEGEVYTAPLEQSVRGTLVIDGALYHGPPQRPFSLQIEQGRVSDLDQLDRDDPHQRMLYNDLSRDAGASQVAEFGLGINPKARADADIMEAEMARGTCHLGFGHNLPFGGANASAIHTDVSMLAPTLAVDGQIICQAGRYLW